MTCVLALQGCKNGRQSPQRNVVGWIVQLGSRLDCIAARCGNRSTYELDEDDPKKFSMKSPKKVSDAYRRIYNCPPYVRDGKQLLPTGFCGIPAHRLSQDIMKTVEYWKLVFDNDGRNQNTNVKGHRGDELREAAKNGFIKRKRGGPDWLGCQWAVLIPYVQQ